MRFNVQQQVATSKAFKKFTFLYKNEKAFEFKQILNKIYRINVNFSRFK